METFTDFKKIIAGTLFLLLAGAIGAQENMKDEIMQGVDGHFYNLRHRLDVLEKKIDDVLWFKRAGGITE